MEISVTTLWVVYIIVLIVLAVLFTLIGYATTRNSIGMHIGVAIIFSAIFSAILFFLLSTYIDVNSLSDRDRTWWSVGYYVAVGLPFLVLIIMLWVAEARASNLISSMTPWAEKQHWYRDMYSMPAMQQDVTKEEDVNITATSKTTTSPSRRTTMYAAEK